jgi:hypothetical protein
MNPTIVVIHGVRCYVASHGQDDYRVQRADTGATLASAARRFAAIAKAAVLLHTPRRQP